MAADPGIAALPQPAPAAGHFGASNMAASAAPGVGDDCADGYSAGSLWYDSANVKLYLCVNASPGAAVWKQITLT